MKVWFITGTSRGFGRVWAEAALNRGDRVVATATNAGDLSDLRDRFGGQVLALPLDVRDREAAGSALAEGLDRFGRLDVVVNNAGYGHLGMVEEFEPADIRDQFEVNFFGAVWVTQACLPILRSQGSGHLIQVTSMGGLVAYPYFGVYNVSKWALEGLSQALAGEVRPFGIKVTIVEAVGYATDWWGASKRHAARLPAYAEQRADFEANWASAGPGRGDPRASAPAMLALADAAQPPLRLMLGAGGLERMEAEYASRLEVWREWNQISVAAHRQLVGGTP
jgi:NAD(P)-dependent dehydrogenase (short-subunit alcohol dehydrogenase family)